MTGNFNMNFIKILCFILLIKFIKASTNEYGVLAVESSSEKENFCIIYFKEFGSLPEKKAEAEFYIIDDASGINWCTDVKNDTNGKIVIITRNNCSVTEQASNVQSQGGKSVLFITPNGEIGSISVNDSYAEGLNITVGLIAETTIKKLKTMGYPLSGRLFAPYDFNFDLSLIVIWVTAMFTVIVGAYWSGVIRCSIFLKENNLLPGRSERDASNLPKSKSATEESSINVSPYYVTFFVFCMVVMLLLLYFFFDYLVYIIIALFVIASILSLHSCLEPLILKIPTSFCKSFVCHLGSMAYNVDLRQVILVAFSIAISVWWLIIRKQKYSWILQDVLGVTFCIHMLKSIRLPNLKICTVLLVLLFFYDIFFVFITPLFTMKGQSVMEQVATGGKSDESLPMVLKIAHFRFDDLAVCYQQYSILGFGDILIPGLLISYCHGFDCIAQSRVKFYFFLTAAMYGLGLQLTFVGLYYMDTAQPALLYLVPCTLIPVILLGLYRGELGLLWYGVQLQPIEPVRYPDVQIATDVAVPETNAETPPVLAHSSYHNEVTPPPDTVNEVIGEKNQLLR